MARQRAASAAGPGHGQNRTAGTYGVLVRHFFGRFFDNESLSPQADASANLGALLGMLAVPGAFLIFVLLSVTLTGWGLVTFRFFFVAYAMITIAFIVVFKWDALFPDARDSLILSPLPLSPALLFVAKISALAVMVGLFLADVSVFGILLWPAIDNTGGSSLRVMAAHTASIAAAGLFAALAAASFQGILVTLLPHAVFRRVSSWMQTLLMSLLVMLLFLIPLLGHSIKGLALTNHPLLRSFPGFWYIGVYELLLPATGHPALLAAGHIGLPALALAGVVLVCTYLPAYRRHCRNVLNGAQPGRAGRGTLRGGVERVLNRFVLRFPVERAVFWFITATIARSMKHRLFLATYAGFGAALAVLSFFSGPLGILRLPLTLSFVLVSGLRAAFSFPSELRANWTFQISESQSAAAYLRAMRKWIALCAVVPLFGAMLPFHMIWLPWRAALFHSVFGLTLSLLLIEIMFFDFRKVAFTCSYFPGKMNLVGLAVVYITGFTVYSNAMAMLGAWLVTEPAAAAAFFAVAAITGGVLAHWRERANGGPCPLDYEDPGEPAVQTLELASQ